MEELPESKTKRLDKASRSIYICKYDLARAIQLPDGGIEIPPHKNDFNKEQVNEIVYYIAKGFNKVTISSNIGVPVLKLEIFMMEMFNTKKITEIRKAVMLEDSTFPEIRDRIIQEASKKKGKKEKRPELMPK